MKNTTMRKLAGIAAIVTLASCMMAPMGMTAFATATTYTITINNDVAGHTYEAYQIFAGTLSTDGTKLSNVTWGAGIDSTKTADLLTAIKDIEGFSTCTDAASVAAALALNNDNETAAEFASIVSQYLGTAQATQATQSDDSEDQDEIKEYVLSGLFAGYYLVKDQDDSQNKENGSYTSFILKVVKNESATPKSAIPSVVKKVQENTDVNDYTENGETRTDYNDVADYNIGDDVPFALYGTMPSNIGSYTTYQYIFHDTLSNGLAFNADSVEVKVGSSVVAADCYTVTNNGNTLTVSFDDILSLVDDADAAIAISSSSIITVSYTAELDTDAVIGLEGNPNEVYLEYSNNPNVGGEGDTGTTPKDQVIVFTYGIEVDKVDQADPTKALTGAEFKLLNANKSMAATVTDGKFAGWVEIDAGTVLTGGTITVAGLDDGTYYMLETKAPDGYNLPTGDAAYFEITVDATTVNNQAWGGVASDALTALASDDDTDWDVDVQITNTQGSTLPSTGGIGTTLFYVIGGTMAAGAGVYLISKKRMNKED